ncbi:hypothetical protein C8R41DRAFT_815044 [Lentinula lateritia]|uniref:Mitochondrial zinc maintenance protein 1, mitochondrial n=1 Tax=Lentinula lateritia TaxID=40482 RepID=A0ABQ8VSC0_9AGAR|nr:hypothetical protein C8R41DRAFT_815044 [Lentinula lateritia]
MLEDVSIPSQKSLNFRNNLAHLVSPLRRVRPRVPFFRLAAHRIPTLWGLFRGLLRAAPTEHIYHRVRVLFEQNRHRTGTERTIQELRKGYKWLETFKRAQAGDVKTQAVIQRYDRFLRFKAEKEHWTELVLKEVEWQEHLKNRPIFTGGFVHPTVFHPPFPRMKPQPMAISRIIANRMKQRERRFSKMEELTRMRDMVRKEQHLEQEIMREARRTGEQFEPVFEGEDWSTPLVQAANDIYANVKATAERNLRPFSPELIEQVRAARRNKIANKTKERERERRGEILRVTRKRWRKGLTPHLLSTLSEKQKREELIVQRSIAEVGYVGLLKKRKGWKLKEPKPKVEGKYWSVEDAEWIGKEEREAAKKALLAIQEENERRRESSSVGD